MSESSSRFFELADIYGRDEHGNLEPLADASFAIAMPFAAGNGAISVRTDVTRVGAADALTDDLPGRFIPGTRIIETSNPLLAAGILGTGVYREIDAPSKAAIARAVGETKAHVEARKQRDRQVALGNEPAPDSTDAQTPAPPPLTGAVAFAHTMTADDRLAIDHAIANGDLLDDTAFTGYIAESSIDDILAGVGTDRLLALRAHTVESARETPRKGLLDGLAAILTTTPEG